MSTGTGLAELMHVARLYMNAAVQISNAYNAEQARLEVNDVLMPARLATSEGAAQSLATIEQLRSLTLVHKEAFGRFIVDFARDMNAALEKLPETQRAEQQNGLLASLNRQLALQGSFYANRHRWLDAAAGMFKLVDDHREMISFTSAGIEIEDDELLDRFNALAAVVEKIHHIETAALQERMECIRQGMAVLAG